MSRSTPTALRLVPAFGEPDLSQQQLPGFAPHVAARATDELTPIAPARSGKHRARGVLRLVGARATGDRGMATAEYAVGLIAACAFALVLYKVVTGTPIFQLLNELAERALNIIP